MKRKQHTAPVLRFHGRRIKGKFISGYQHHNTANTVGELISLLHELPPDMPMINDEYTDPPEVIVIQKPTTICMVCKDD